MLMWLVVYSSTCSSPTEAQFLNMSQMAPIRMVPLYPVLQAPPITESTINSPESQRKHYQQHSQHLAGGIMSSLTILTCSVNLGCLGRR